MHEGAVGATYKLRTLLHVEGEDNNEEQRCTTDTPVHTDTLSSQILFAVE